LAGEPRIVSAAQHYDLLIEEGNDPFRDGPLLQQYMSRWDGPQFFAALGPVEGKDVLEVGVGTGRLARRVLDAGCRTFTGLDISAKTVDRARENLSGYANVRIVLGNIEDYQFSDCFDVAYSVLTFMHIERKRQALANIVNALWPNGVLVLSLSSEGEWLDFGNRRVKLHNTPVEDYIGWLIELGCRVDPPVDLVDRACWMHGSCSALNESNHGVQRVVKVATLLRAQRLGAQPTVEDSAAFDRHSADRA
jgi:SAM-dependent methyltransferase